jgi:hypothetical protein
MTMPVYVDQSKIVKRARAEAETARTNMFASFALLQLDVQTTHQKDWDSISVRQLEDKIDEFKAACFMFRRAQDGIVKAMAMGGDRPDSAVPSPNELDGRTPDGWTTVVQDGIPVLVPVAATSVSDPASGE